ncbi:hypothetical protein [Bifidobacterium pseudolongum]|uniref:hypothetical protein n=1 Tax=Bifidobacterium pseudolongum TaxID=1694 RepID=UPI001F111B19|nr:hypothetical protein [Bifidobacterium pseudolongum]MCH4856987.1 hypothetical protein [Bifidobacterium pseudolongum]
MFTRFYPFGVWFAFFRVQNVSKRWRLSGHARHRQQPGVDEFECADQIAIDCPHAFVGAHLVECPPCVGAPVWFDADIELEMVDAIKIAFTLPVIDVDDVMIAEVLVLIIGVRVDVIETER